MINTKAVELNNKINSTFINISNGNKVELILVSNIYSTNINFIPTASYKYEFLDIIWSKTVDDFLKEFKII